MGESKEKIKIILREIIQETSDIYSFVFDVPEDFQWIAGQHGIFRFTDREIEDKDFRIFSFASIKEEKTMIFSTRIIEIPSDYKKNLLLLEPGDIMTIDGAVGKFILDDYKQITCVMAGGIGITPVRAFMKQIDELGINPTLIKVLYSDDRGEFAYEQTLLDINAKYEGLDLEFISDRNIFTDKIAEFASEHENKALYYIAGTPGMNSFLTDKLIGLGIEKNQIKTDVFTGY
ncbi:MAG: FAD-dependent oxidoreductase [Dethiosulfatibacter sp.]|nr:FAD-dependent oxidoreductase [Dethiosulfatibacter sp.]